MLTDSLVADRRAVEHFAHTHQCADCKAASALVVRWDGKASQWEVYCPPCGNRERFTQPESLTAMWRRDPGSVPITIANRMANKHRHSIESEIAGLPDDLAMAIREKYLG